MPPHTFFLLFFCRRNTWFVSFHRNVFQIWVKRQLHRLLREEASSRLLRVWSVYRVLLGLINPMSPVILLGLQTPRKKERKSTTNKQTNIGPRCPSRSCHFSNPLFKPSANKLWMKSPSCERRRGTTRKRRRWIVHLHHIWTQPRHFRWCAKNKTKKEEK